MQVLLWQNPRKKKRPSFRVKLSFRIPFRDGVLGCRPRGKMHDILVANRDAYDSWVLYTESIERTRITQQSASSDKSRP